MRHECNVEVASLDGILDQPFQVSISGLEALQEIVLNCRTSDDNGMAWVASAT